MIVTPHEARRIVAGRKTEHRIARYRKPPAPGAIVPVSYKTPNSFLGYTEAGEPRAETRLACRIRIGSVEPGELLDATKEDARAEGYRSVPLMLAAWGDPEDPTPVWILRFEALREDRPRLLSSAIIAGRQGDYVEQAARALPDEPEAVDEVALEQFARESRNREWDRERVRRITRGEMSFQEQVAEFAAEARRRHIDIRDELRAIRRWNDPLVCRRQLDTIRRKLEHPRSAA